MMHVVLHVFLCHRLPSVFFRLPPVISEKNLPASVFMPVLPGGCCIVDVPVVEVAQYHDSVKDNRASLAL